MSWPRVHDWIIWVRSSFKHTHTFSNWSDCFIATAIWKSYLHVHTLHSPALRVGRMSWPLVNDWIRINNCACACAFVRFWVYSYYYRHFMSAFTRWRVFFSTFIRGKIVHCGEIKHGKTSKITHDGKGIYKGLPAELDGTCVNKWPQSILRMYFYPYSTKQFFVLMHTTPTHMINSEIIHDGKGVYKGLPAELDGTCVKIILYYRKVCYACIFSFSFSCIQYPLTWHLSFLLPRRIFRMQICTHSTLYFTCFSLWCIHAIKITHSRDQPWNYTRRHLCINHSVLE